MIPMWRINGEWQQVRGNPIVTSLDGRYRAPLRTILHPSWTWPERWAYGIHELEPSVIPEGFVSIKHNYRIDPDNIIREEHFLERVPEPEGPPFQTDRVRDRTGPGRPERRTRLPTPGVEPIR